MAAPAMKDTFAKGFVRFHQLLFDVSKGRIGGTGFGMPVVKLTTTGRKSGQLRTTMLTSPVQLGEAVVLVASYGGDPRHPTWFLNLRDNPDVEITMRGRTRRMQARIAAADERAELWPSVVAAYKGYAQYQTKTDREIPLVVLDPAT